MKGRGDSVAAFLAWCLAGAGLCLGVLSILTIGPFVLLLTLFFCAFLLWRVDFGWGMAGIVSGAALPMLYIAWLNRDGPGSVCTGDSRAISCGDEWSPWPFVVGAVVLVVAGIATFARQRDR